MSLPGKIAPRSTGNPTGAGVFQSVILKYPGNTAATIEPGDVTILLDADNLIFKQWNGATFDEVTQSSLPNQ